MTKQSRVPVVARMIALGLATDETTACELIDRRLVLVQGAIVDNPSRLVALGDAIVVTESERFVSRGGFKLAAALEHFAISLTDRSVLDVGASTGGFTDCALQSGARIVYALDVGKTQLHERLRAHPQVVIVDEFNARGLGDSAMKASRGVPPVLEVIVVDVSFISVARLAEGLISSLAPDGDLVVLIKPQFEASKEEADRGAGIIASPEIRSRVVEEVKAAFALSGCDCLGVIESPITGASGNTEFLAHFRMRK